MKNFLACGALVAVSAVTLAQAPAKSLSATLEVYVFPSDGQDVAQQSKDEAACYEWAVSNAGVDPFELEKQAQADAEKAEAEMAAASQAGKGSTGRSAVRGAAAGALVGEIANDDASEGAAWGAAAGAVHGRRSGKQASAEAQQSAAASADDRAEATAEQMQNFKKAFSVCLEAKEYLVKY